MSDLTIKYYSQGKSERKLIPLDSDICAVLIPAGPVPGGPDLPALEVNVSHDGIVIDTQDGRRVGFVNLSELVAEMVAETPIDAPEYEPPPFVEPVDE